jgi:hypothetical protein
MSIKADIDALTERFRLQWAGLRPTVPVAWENSPAIDPQPNQAYVMFAVRVGTKQRGYIGNIVGPYQSLGRVWVSIFVPVNEGTAIADELVDDVLSIFRRWRSADGAVRVDDGEINTITSDLNWHQVNVSMPYVSWRNH